MISVSSAEWKESPKNTYQFPKAPVSYIHRQPTEKLLKAQSHAVFAKDPKRLWTATNVGSVLASTNLGLRSCTSDIYCWLRTTCPFCIALVHLVFRPCPKPTTHAKQGCLRRPLVKSQVQVAELTRTEA